MRFEGLFQKGNQMYQWKVHANSAIFSKCCFESNYVIQGRGAVERDPGMFSKTHLILFCRPSVMLSNASRDQYFVSKIPQNQEQRNDYNIAPKAVVFPISGSCFISLKKTRLSSLGVQHVQAQGFPSTENRNELLPKAPRHFLPSPRGKGETSDNSQCLS